MVITSRSSACVRRGRTAETSRRHRINRRKGAPSPSRRGHHWIQGFVCLLVSSRSSVPWRTTRYSPVSALKPSTLARVESEWLSTSQRPVDRAVGDAGVRSIALRALGSILGMASPPRVLRGGLALVELGLLLVEWALENDAILTRFGVDHLHLRPCVDRAQDHVAQLVAQRRG